MAGLGTQRGSAWFALRSVCALTYLIRTLQGVRHMFSKNFLRVQHIASKEGSWCLGAECGRMRIEMKALLGACFEKQLIRKWLRVIFICWLCIPTENVVCLIVTGVKMCGP